MNGYFKTPHHFENFLRKVLREAGQNVDRDQLMPASMYVDAAYTGGVADEFGLALRADPTLLHEDSFWKWLQSTKLNGFVMDRGLSHITTPEMQDAMRSLHKLPGVYSFWNEREMPLYAGVSIDLASRICSSFSERFRHYVDVVYLRYAVTKTASDAAVMEAVVIATLKPALNTTGKYDDELTLGIAMPGLSDPVAVNVPGKKAWEDGVFVVKDEEVMSC